MADGRNLRGRTYDLLVLGDCNVDLMLHGGDVEPRFGQVERLVEQALLTVGGSGAITACGAARLGLRTALVGVVGDDVFGRFLLDHLAQRQVDVDHCAVSSQAGTGVTVVLARPDDRATLTALGTIASLSADRVSDELLQAARHVHVSSYYLQHALRPDLPDLFDRARRLGATTSIDPNYDPAEGWDSGLVEVLGRTDYLLPNAREAIAIAGVTDVGEAAGSLAARGPVTVVKRGARGAIAHDGSRALPMAAPPVEAVDTTGAGDSFDAGFLAGVLAGGDVEAALRLAVACGALSTRAMGGTDAQPTRGEAERVWVG